MVEIVMTVLVTELVYESNKWALRLKQEPDQPVIFDPLDLLQELAEAGAKQMVIDLGRTSRSDSIGLKFLLNIYQEGSSRGISITLRNPNQHLHRILKIMQLNRLFLIEHQEAEDDDQIKDRGR